MSKKTNESINSDYVTMKLAQAAAQPINTEAYNRILDSLFADTGITDQVKLMNLRAACLEIAEFVQGGYSPDEYAAKVNGTLNANDLATTGVEGKINRRRAMAIANNINAMESPNKLLGTRGKPTRGFQPPPATSNLDGYSLFSDDDQIVPK